MKYEAVQLEKCSEVGYISSKKLSSQWFVKQQNASKYQTVFFMHWNVAEYKPPFRHLGTFVGHFWAFFQGSKNMAATQPLWTLIGKSEGISKYQWTVGTIHRYQTSD